MPRQVWANQVPDDCRRRSATLIEGMSSYQPRRPAGVPTGGQFASKSQPALGYTLDDGPAPATIDGRPVEAEVEVRDDGGRTESYYRDRLIPHDPDDGRLAVVAYRPDGTVETAEHWQRGVRQD